MEKDYEKKPGPRSRQVQFYSESSSIGSHTANSQAMAARKSFAHGHCSVYLLLKCQKSARREAELRELTFGFLSGPASALRVGNCLARLGTEYPLGTGLGFCGLGFWLSAGLALNCGDSGFDFASCRKKIPYLLKA